MTIYGDQPTSTSDMWNRLEYRPLEGFVYAITPFNAIAANLPASAAMMGNVVWKPSDSQIFSAQIIIEVFEAVSRRLCSFGDQE
jgi:1-pyrroline-5-carboxylate dehydrogenase